MKEIQLPKFNLKGLKGKLKKKWVIIGIVILVLLICFFVFKGFFRPKQTGMPQTSQSPVMRRDITASITGTAVVQPKDQYSVTSLVNGEVLSARFEEGDYVNEGDVLYEIDASDIEKSIKSAELAVEKAQQNYNDAISSKEKNTFSNQNNLESAENSVQRAEQSYNDANKTVGDLIIKSDISGVVGEMYVKEGDNVSAGMNIARVYDDSSIQIKIPFNEDDAMQIHAGETAELTLTGSGETLNGVVSEVNNASEIKDGYMKVRYVTIRVDSPGALSPSDKATARVGNFYCNDEGVFEYLSEKTITAKTGGTVDTINITQGNEVNVGETLVILTSDSAVTQRQNASLSLKDAQLAYDKAQNNMDDYASDSQIKNAKIALEDAKINLEKLREAGDDYKVTAPISGQIISKNTKAGDKLDNANSQEAMAIIYDLSSLEFDMMIDELDINKISVGQEVKITADALGGKEYIGHVSKISIVGTEANGVTSYPVSVDIVDFDEDLLPGMNIDAEIVIANVTDVLAVPKSAVNRGNVVYVLGEKEDPADKAPEGFKSVTVETGVNDGSFIEIISGLTESDVVKIQTSSSFGMMMPGMTMGGGMPMGGGPMGGGPMAGGGGRR